MIPGIFYFLMSAKADIQFLDSLPVRKAGGFRQNDDASPSMAGKRRGTKPERE